MNDDKFDETSERTSLFQSNNNSGREPWKATRSLYQQRLKQQQHQQQQQQQQQQQNHHRLLDEDDEDEEEEDHEYCCADQASLTHQQHTQILFHQPKNLQCNASHNHFRIPYQHHKLQQTPSPPSHQRHYNNPLLTNSPRCYHHHNHHQQQQQQQQHHHHHHDDDDDHHNQEHHHNHHLQSDHQQVTPCTPAALTKSSIFNTVQPTLNNNNNNNNSLPATFNQVFCGGRLETRCQRSFHVDSNASCLCCSSPAGLPHHAAIMKTSPSCKPHIYTSSCSTDCPHLSAIPNDHIILTWNYHYCSSFQGILRLLQVIFSVVSLVCLTTSGRHEGGYLSLPLCWHFRIMVFILVLTLLSSFVVWTFHAIGLSSAFPINWYFLDMIAYSIFAFLYLVGASLVASAFDFYEKMQVGVTHQTIQQLILSVIIGYICLFLYGTTAVIGYRQWRIQLKQYQHRKLLEEDNFEM